MENELASLAILARAVSFLGSILRRRALAGRRRRLLYVMDPQAGNKGDAWARGNA